MNIQQEYYTKKISFMQSLLALLPFEEWSNKLLEAAEKKCGFAKGYYELLFPDGLGEIVDFFQQYQDDNMLMQLAKIDVPPKVRDKISLALKIRIKSLPPIIHSKNAAYLALHATQGTKIAFRSCDLIWHYAGDQSLDYNYYTKRGLLLTVYLSAILYYIQDDSENYVDTDQFIDDSLGNIIKGFSHIKNLTKLIDPANIPIIRMFS